MAREDPHSEPTPSASVDEDARRNFFYGIGRCIDRWAYVDRQLYLVFRLVLKLDPTQASLLFYRVPTFGQRLNLVEDALRAVFDRKELEKTWIPLAYKIRGLSLIRHIFAHHPVEQLTNARGYGIYIEPFLRTQLRKNGLPADKEEFEIGDLKQHSHAIAELQMALVEFSRSLNRPPPAAAPPRNPISQKE